jgi:hypothetical protein
MFGMDPDETGALVAWIAPGSPADNKIFPGDILLTIDGHRIADDGTVEFRPNERTGCDYYIKQHQIGEEAVYTVLRKGTVKTIRLLLDQDAGCSNLVPAAQYDVRPSYFVYGGLVFSPLSFNYLLAWGADWDEDAPYNLLTWFIDGRLTRKGEEVVVAIKVLPSDVNAGYEKFVNERIVEVNGKKILNLRDLVQAVEAGSPEPYVVFKSASNKTIVLDRKEVEEEQGEILATYEIPNDRSVDLKTAVSKGRGEAGGVAKVVSSKKGNLR